MQRVELALGSMAMIAVLAISSHAGEPAGIAPATIPAAAQPPTDGQELDFDRACAEPPPTEEALNATGGKRETPHQDPQHPFTAPQYPEAARQDLQEGEVVMLLLVNEKGEVVRARVDRSSGYPMLDRAALEAAGNWSIRPGTANGAPVCSWGRFSMHFRLSDFEPDEVRNARIRKGARRLLELVERFPEGDLQDQIASAASAGVPNRTSRILSGLVLDTGDSRARLDEAAHDSLALISLEFSDDEIEAATKFLEGPVAAKLFHLEPELDRTLKDQYLPAFFATSCQVTLLRNALDKRHAALGELPAGLRAAAPRLLAASSSFCRCAARQPEWQRSVRPGLAVPIAVARTCGDPPDLTW